LEGKRLVVCSLTLDRDSHGPAKFAQIIYRYFTKYKNLNYNHLTKDKGIELPNVIRLSDEYPPRLGFLWEYFDSWRMYRWIVQADKVKPIDALLFVDARLAFWSTILLPKRIVKIGMLNDYEQITQDRLVDKGFKTWLLFIKARFIEKYSCEKVNLVLYNSKFLEIINQEKTSGFQIKKGKILYKSIELDGIEPKTNCNIDVSRDIKVLFVKNDFGRGGLFVLIDALSSLQEYKFSIRIVGVDKGIFDTKIIPRLHAPNVNIQNLGILTNDKVYKIMKEADLFCVPALREALGVANIEAMALCLPVISTNVGGILETTDQGKNAWLAEPNDIKSLAYQIKNCIENNEERKNKAINANIFVREHYNHRRMINTLESLLISEINQPKNPQ
jgi:colanic acid/amylovoran biosynthesis glycosyltransferase